MNETPSRRHLGFAALTLWIALPGAWSCAESRPRRDTAGAEDTVQVLYYSANSETWQDFGQPVLTLLFMPLMHEHGGDMEGRLARSREMSADGRAWTYHLRTDVRWHDGVPVTAHDIEFTIKLFQNLDHRNPLAAQRGLGRTVEVIDDSTFTITFELYRDDFVWTPREVFLPSHLLEGLDPADMAEWEFWNAPVGNGPYRFVRMIPNEFIELEASPDYFAGPPGIQRVFLRAGGAWMTMLHAGEVDILTEVGGLTAASLADDPRYRIYQWPSSRPGRITWNHRHPILGDPRVRRALSLTVDRGELAVISGYPADLPTWDVPISRSRLMGALARVPEPLAPDPARARKLLSEAGWEDRDGDGIRERGGQALRFELLTSAEGTAVILQQQFRRIGVHVDIHSIDNELRRDRFREGAFDAILGSMPRDPDRVAPLLTGVPSALAGYEGPELALLDAVLDTTFLEEARERLYEQAWPIVRRDLPATFLLSRLSSTIANSRIRGVSGRDGVAILLHMDELWIEATVPGGPG